MLRPGTTAVNETAKYISTPIKKQNSRITVVQRPMGFCYLTEMYM